MRFSIEEVIVKLNTDYPLKLLIKESIAIKKKNEKLNIFEVIFVDSSEYLKEAAFKRPHLFGDIDKRTELLCIVKSKFPHAETLVFRGHDVPFSILANLLKDDRFKNECSAITCDLTLLKKGGTYKKSVG